MWSTSFRRTATPMSNLVVFLIIMDKELGEHLNFIYKEYRFLSTEITRLSEELRDAKRQIDKLSSGSGKTAMRVQFTRKK